MEQFNNLYTILKTRAVELFKNNHRVGTNLGLNYDYTCPSPCFYPHQWLWDSCFHAITLTHLDPERAKREIKTLLLKQRTDGFIPCVSLWQKTSFFETLFYKFYSRMEITMITQPPVIPLAVEIIYKQTSDLHFVKEVYPKLNSFLEWLGQKRDRNNNGLMEIIHPWEAGCDSIPSFDKQLGIENPKPRTPENFYTLFKVLIKYNFLGWNPEKIYKSKIFIVENVLFNSIYAQALYSMKNLAKALGRAEDSKTFEKRYEKTKEALIKLCWAEKDKIFYDLDENGKQIRVKTISSLMPLILEGLSVDIAREVIGKHLLNPKEFWSNFPIPSVSADEPSFNPNKSLILWRGPTWINTNWFLAKALINCGYKKEARQLILKTANMIKKDGFFEFYNPITGEGYGQPNFGWSTLVIDMLSYL